MAQALAELHETDDQAPPTHTTLRWVRIASTEPKNSKVPEYDANGTHDARSSHHTPQ